MKDYPRGPLDHEDENGDLYVYKYPEGEVTRKSKGFPNTIACAFGSHSWYDPCYRIRTYRYSNIYEKIPRVCKNCGKKDFREICIFDCDNDTPDDMPSSLFHMDKWHLAQWQLRTNSNAIWNAGYVDNWDEFKNDVDANLARNPWESDDK